MDTKEEREPALILVHLTNSVSEILVNFAEKGKITNDIHSRGND